MDGLALSDIWESDGGNEGPSMRKQNQSDTTNRLYMPMTLRKIKSVTLGTQPRKYISWNICPFIRKACLH